MEDLLLMTCIPVSGIVIGQDGSEEMNKHVAISENSSVKFLCCYLPSGGKVSLNLNGLPIKLDVQNKMVFVWWWNPSDGLLYDISRQKIEKPVEISLEKNEIISLNAPSEGEENDWVLIVMTQ